MKIEILCNGCDDCEMLQGKVCQAVVDLNLDAEILSTHDPKRHVFGRGCTGVFQMRIDGLNISAKSDCTVQDLMLILNKELHLNAYS
jgi:hypothetical protein